MSYKSKFWIIYTLAVMASLIIAVFYFNTGFAETITETLIYSDYEISKLKKSRIDPEKTYRVIVGVRCPGSNGWVEPIKHGESVFCPNGDKLTVWGNSLVVEGERP